MEASLWHQRHPFEDGVRRSYLATDVVVVQAPTQRDSPFNNIQYCNNCRRRHAQDGSDVKRGKLFPLLVITEIPTACRHFDLKRHGSRGAKNRCEAVTDPHHELQERKLTEFPRGMLAIAERCVACEKRSFPGAQSRGPKPPQYPCFSCSALALVQLGFLRSSKDPCGQIAVKQISS